MENMEFDLKLFFVRTGPSFYIYTAVYNKLNHETEIVKYIGMQ